MNPPSRIVFMGLLLAFACMGAVSASATLQVLHASPVAADVAVPARDVPRMPRHGAAQPLPQRSPLVSC